MKHTFSREQVRAIILEELQADLLIENTTRQILQEGMFDTVKKLKGYILSKINSFFKTS